MQTLHFVHNPRGLGGDERSSRRGSGGRLGRYADAIVGSDPGLNRLLAALHVTMALGLTLAAEYLLVHLTHAQQRATPPGRLAPAVAAQLSAGNHDVVVLTMAMGAIVALTASLGIQGPTVRKELESFALLLPVAVVTLVIGLEAAPHRVLSLAVLVAVLSGGTYCRRFGPAGALVGVVAFAYDLTGFFSDAILHVGDLGWPIAEIGVGVAVTVVLQLVVFRSRPSAALRRARHAFDVRARNVLAMVLVTVDRTGHDERDLARLERRLTGLNEAALIIDGQLGEPGALDDGTSAERVHQRLFDIELALTSLSRLAPLMGSLELATDHRREARRALVALVDGHRDAVRSHSEHLLQPLRADPTDDHGAGRPEIVVPYRFASALLALADAMDAEDRELAEGQDGTASSFTSAVTLLRGALPGAALASAVASTRGPASGHGSLLRTRSRLAPHARTAVQVAVAASVAITLGDLRSGRRFYWALIAVLVVFMGTSNAGEQVRKAMLRVAGTAAGILVGGALAHAVGRDHPYWTVAVILAAIFFGIYLIRISYAFMVIGVTVTLSQLYAQVGEFSNSLLLARLEEMCIGAAVALVVATCVLPLRTRDVLHRSLHDLMTSVADLATDASTLLAGEAAAGPALRQDARRVDTAYQTTIAAAAPIRRGLTGRTDDEITAALGFARAARHYSRNLVADVTAAHPLDGDARAAVTAGSATICRSFTVIADAMLGDRTGTYHRAAADLSRLERDFERHYQRSGASVGAWMAVRDLRLVEVAGAWYAERIGLAVTD